jgi:hypothetical protein
MGNSATQSLAKSPAKCILPSLPTVAEPSALFLSENPTKQKLTSMSAKKPSAAKAPSKKPVLGQRGEKHAVKGHSIQKDAKSGCFIALARSSEAKRWRLKVTSVVVTETKKEAMRIARDLADGRINLIVEETKVERISAKEFDRIFDEGDDLSTHLDWENAQWVPPLKS